MDTPNIPTVGELIEKGQKTAVNTTKTAVSDVTQTVSDQIGLKNEPNSPKAQTPNAPTQESSSQASQEDLEATKDMVSEYYSPSQIQFNAQQAELMEQQRQAKLADVRQKLALELHNETYFNEIRDAGATKPQAQISEQKKIEEVKQQNKMADLETAQKKDEDLAKFRAERRVEIVGGPVG